MTLVRTRRLVAGPAGIPAVRNLDLNVDQGEVVALLGPNGAGKSVTLATVAGVLPVIDGEVEVMGQRANGHSIQSIARRGLAYLPSGRGLFSQRTAAENLRLYRHRHSSVTVSDVLEYFPPLEQHLPTKVGLLSGGEQQMLALACQLITEPGVMLIDELSHGLGPVIVEQLLDTLRAIVHTTAVGVLLVEQSLGHALDVADRAYLLSSGELILSGTADEVRAAGDVIELAYLGARSPLGRGRWDE